MNGEMPNMLVPCRSISGIMTKRNDTTRALIVNDEGVEIIMLFSKTEYKLICALIGDVIVDDQTLIALLYDSNELDREIRKVLKRHLVNVKNKLRPSNLFVRRVHGYGYSLVAKKKP